MKVTVNVFQRRYGRGFRYEIFAHDFHAIVCYLAATLLHADCKVFDRILCASPFHWHNTDTMHADYGGFSNSNIETESKRIKS